MNAGKNIGISVVGEHGEVEWSGGSFSINDFQNIVIKSQQLDFVCIGLIDLFGDTYFNQKQCTRILDSELKILKRNKSIKKELIQAIEIGCKKVLEESWSYLKIAGATNFVIKAEN